MITLQEARTTRKYKIAHSVSKIIKTLSKRKNGVNRHPIKELINDGVNQLLSSDKSYATLSKEKITIYKKGYKVDDSILFDKEIITSLNEPNYEKFKYNIKHYLIKP